MSALGEARIVGSRSHRNPALEQALAALGARELVALGSAGLKASVVAHGAADAYVAPHYAGKRWDACAADALITAAGGKLTDSRGDASTTAASRSDNDRGVIAEQRPVPRRDHRKACSPAAELRGRSLSLRGEHDFERQ